MLTPEAESWSSTFERLFAKNQTGELGAHDLERLAEAAYMLGRDDDCRDAWVAAHHRWLSAGSPAKAAGCALWLALGLFFRGDMAPALGWVARSERLLQNAEPDCVEQAWLRMLKALPVLFGGDGASVYPILVEAERLGATRSDSGATMFARLCEGYALILQGQLQEGVRLLDEVMVTATSREVGPMLTGIAYCQVISLCQSIFDVRRATEWTRALSTWCDEQPDLVPFRGNCLVHRCEIFQLHGAWKEAHEAALRACEWLRGPPAWDTLGSAHYQLGEIERLKGNLVAAEKAYRQASLAGRDPEPGLSLVRLAQGRAQEAASSLRRALAEAHDPIARSRLLPALVDVSLEAGAGTGAREAADELTNLAAGFASPYLFALAAQARGAVLLAEGDAAAALAELRKALRLWREIQAPHETARVRALIGAACRGLADPSGADLEFEAARAAFEALGAQPELRRLGHLAGSFMPSGALSGRETEVLVLVAAGKTNRAIAAELVISEKTVARHLSNIFSKIGVSTRAEATAYAFKHGLVS